MPSGRRRHRRSGFSRPYQASSERSPVYAPPVYSSPSGDSGPLSGLPADAPVCAPHPSLEDRRPLADTNGAELVTQRRRIAELLEALGHTKQRPEESKAGVAKTRPEAEVTAREISPCSPGRGLAEKKARIAELLSVLASHPHTPEAADVSATCLAAQKCRIRELLDGLRGGAPEFDRAEEPGNLAGPGMQTKLRIDRLLRALRSCTESPRGAGETSEVACSTTTQIPRTRCA